ncbi:hypothetical protein [Rugosimonospora africana]|uniref:Secreted protein n=1 Tax=Rugosimonospora africana TaxID=556532 RepID=A0A8J3VSE7_9ACTN|nr:hypothetical protein [Rugosimonospora africana]GIH16511.1 hypothetical protein Raf01_46830 [Rugosimonospora africana]
MTTTAIVILVIVVVVVAALIAFAVTYSRRRALRERFGPEYERLVAEQNSRSAAEHELRERERKHAELDLHPLSASSRAGYAAEWADVQTRFVDSPQDAVRAGDELVTRLVREIGYPTDDYEERLATLSVEHARTLSHYRDAHDISLRNESGQASTEQLRQALVHYRALFGELLGDEPVPETAEPVQAREPETEPEVPAARTDVPQTDGPRSDAPTR